jgi:SAM-dependent methyltransferase
LINLVDEPAIMSLVDEYKRQFAWRSWPTIFDALPSLLGQTVLDLGCGPGDLSAEFVARGARVIGVDLNEELLAHARSRQLPGAEFRMGDLRMSPDFGIAADGLWCSFTAAYFPDLTTALAAWARNLKPGGWIAVTEVDDLFGHEPLSARTTSLLTSWANAARAAGYDCLMGRKLRDHLQSSGFTVSKMLRLEDQELSFSGRARPDVLDAWRLRFSRLGLLRDICGPTFDEVREEFLGCLMRADHNSLAKVYCCIAYKERVQV